MSGFILFLPHYAERKPFELSTLLMPTAGIEPGPLVQQASELCITPLPLGRRKQPIQTFLHRNLVDLTRGEPSALGDDTGLG